MVSAVGLLYLFIFKSIKQFSDRVLFCFSHVKDWVATEEPNLFCSKKKEMLLKKEERKTQRYSLSTRTKGKHGCLQWVLRRSLKVDQW